MPSQYVHLVLKSQAVSGRACLADLKRKRINHHRNRSSNRSFTTQNSLFSKAIYAIELVLFPFAITAVHEIRQEEASGTRRGWTGCVRLPLRSRPIWPIELS
jgi:hypothetical protein